jgi:transcription initiation factor IIE alpha subunit
MREQGLSREAAYERIWMIDSKGLIVKVKRQHFDILKYKKSQTDSNKETNPM